MGGRISGATSSGEGVVEPLSHMFDVPDKLLRGTEVFGADPEREAVNVNAFDEVPNSTWFTNRNHVRAVPVTELEKRTATCSLRSHGSSRSRSKAATPWASRSRTPMEIGGSSSWTRSAIHRSARGRGPDHERPATSRGVQPPHNPPVGFRRGDLKIDEDLLRGKGGPPFTEANLDSLLSLGALLSDGSYSGFASLFIPGHVLGSPSSRRLRPGDTNDWYSHMNRRELRGLYVLSSWLNSWDTKDIQFLDTFIETQDSLGYVDHYILDVGASLGVGAEGPKKLAAGFEHTIDFEWTAWRFVTLGFVVEPWRRAHQQTGIPSVGNFESAVYKPAKFKALVPQPAFREMTDRDGYWGAKIVASFSDAQIAAAVDAAHYEDPRAAPFLVRYLIVRRDKIARYWFDRVAPLDFFSVRDGALHFHDLAVDVGLARSRAYDVEIDSPDGGASLAEKVRLSDTALRLPDGGDVASRLSLEFSVAGNGAKPTRVELRREGSVWVVTQVRHG